jgi:hypothetical protein
MTSKPVAGSDRVPIANCNGRRDRNRANRSTSRPANALPPSTLNSGRRRHQGTKKRKIAERPPVGARDQKMEWPDKISVTNDIF